LGLKGSFDGGHVQLGLHPADDYLRCQVSVWDHVALRLLPRQSLAQVGRRCWSQGSRL
jgi:hypothetical protein